MYKSDKEIEELLLHPNNGVKHHFIGQGNNPKSQGQAGGEHKKLSVEEKADIGVLARVVGNKNTSELTGMEVARVGQFKRGLNGNSPDLKLRAEIGERIAPIQSKALDKVDLLLGLINEDKVSDLSPKDAAYTAEKMTSIFERLKPSSPIQIDRAEIHFYAPPQKKVDEYPIIDVEPVSN